MEQSLTKTLATKHHTSVPKILDKYKAELVVGETTYKGLRVTVPRESKKPLVATWGGIPLIWDLQADLVAPHCSQTWARSRFSSSDRGFQCGCGRSSRSACISHMRGMPPHVATSGFLLSRGTVTRNPL